MFNQIRTLKINILLPFIKRVIDIKKKKIILYVIIFFQYIKLSSLKVRFLKMYREFIILASVIVVSLFMTVHNRNKEAMQNSETRLSIQRKTQEKMLIQEGNLMRLNGGITFTKNANLIIIKDPYSTIILDKNSTDEIIAFLEKE